MKVLISKFKESKPDIQVDISNQELDNNYPVYPGYNYVIGDYIVNSDIFGTIFDLKLTEHLPLESVAKTVYIF